MKNKFIDIKFILIIFSVYAVVQLTSGLKLNNWFMTELLRLLLCISVGVIVSIILNTLFKKK
ncbi:hypothetical protein CO726_25015 [Bacillus fungorum]|uniref:Uncharacterized protein n=1 Tax=Bacillus fungorum TaxID=2039284 RepID=A0A2G6Q799_9BACI|nr:hypothetical protein CO726_25015 [Bacillus fungorum]